MRQFIKRIRIEDKDIQEFKDKLSLTDFESRFFLSRGLDNKEKIDNFLYPSIDKMQDPYLLSGMTEAVNVIKSHINKKNKIIVYGDYDCDGVGATAIMMFALKHLGADADYFIPNRKEDGYGLNGESLIKIKNSFQPNLIITVDCGITSVDEVKFAKEQLNLDVIITDHHTPKDTLPDTICINPCLDKNYTPLSGAGVALKLVEALTTREYACKFLDICAISTVADIVPLINDNRVIVAKGLEMMSRFNHRKGIGALIQKSGIKKHANLYSSDIGFRLAPRLNATGRLDTADKAVKLLLSEDATEIMLIAEELEDLNEKRQKLSEIMYQEALELLKEYNLNDNKVIVLHKEDWDLGVIGIVASKISEDFVRPVVLLCDNSGTAKGSARSIKGIDIVKAFDYAKDSITTYGGHTMAAGLTIELNKINTLISKLNEYITISCDKELLKDCYYYDFYINLEELDLNFVQKLEKYHPYGYANPKPLFLSSIENCVFTQIGNHKHIQCKSPKNVNFLAFNNLEILEGVNKCLKANISYSLDLEYYKNKPQAKGFIKNIVIDELSDDEMLLSKYFSLYNAENITFNNYNKAYICNQDFGHLIVVFTCEGLKKAAELYPDYAKTIIIKPSLNPYNAIILSPSNDFNYNYYSKITYLENLPKKYLQLAKEKFSSRLEYNNLINVKQKVDLNIDELRYYYLKMKSIFNYKTFSSITTLFNIYKNILKDANYLKFSFAFNIFKELSLIIVDKSGIINFPQAKVDIEKSSLYKDFT